MSKSPRHNKRKKASSRIAEATSKQRGTSSSRIDAKKHSEAIAYLYETELSEIENMIQSAGELAEHKK